MSVGFGFSVSDFIGAVKLVGIVIDALSASSQSSGELQALLRQLRSLDTTLQTIEQLEVDECLRAEVLALKQSAAECQLDITGFLRKTESYQPHLFCTNGSSSTLQSKWKKVKWALCKRKDVVQFKTDLLVHTQSLQILLTAIQMKHLSLGQKRPENTQGSVASQLQHAFVGCMRKLSVISSTLTGIFGLAQECAENSRRILSMHLRVFQFMLDVQKLLATVIPAQVQRQQPVYLTDALGRYSPFFLEMIRSPESLISVLSDNSSWYSSASRKILKQEFAIQDAHTKRDIKLNLQGMATDVAQKPQDAAQVVLPMMLLGDENEDDEDMSNYHRIRVRVTPQISRVKVRGDKDDGWHDATIELLNLETYAAPIGYPLVLTEDNGTRIDCNFATADDRTTIL
ncbi:MAG: hypothetical protein L6R38_005381 [Xanthoria sp. 2 TBL-2021]|nr:MAG: hypothetical protein L6R38_005381 [Xanthoria sp. 2 TBL-2021]